MRFWTLRTWNYNRAVVLAKKPPDSRDAGAYCQWLKWRVLWQTKFVPFIYELGLQIVVAGEDLSDKFADSRNLTSSVDRFSNQFVVLQSIFVVDLSRTNYISSRSPGLSLTSHFQDSIEAGIRLAGIVPAG